ncbi:MAG: alkaline phosphatase family protein [Planctomycetes bacterium]|nr:alkaline phosphatase family protein [Planctomycetota bacterium]
MAILLGPILHLEKQFGAATWRFSVHVMTDEVDATTDVGCQFDDAAAVVHPAARVAVFAEQRRSVWAFLVEVPRSDGERALTYTITSDGETRRFDAVAIPASDRMPRIVYFSCNGFSSAGLMRQTADPNALWRRMQELHRSGMTNPTPNVPSSIHVMIGGGDQVYADSLPVLEELDRLSSRELRRLQTSTARQAKALREYLELYQNRWSQPEVAEMLARVPVVFTWDDHDIFDGWGSHGEDIQENKAYLDIFAAARAAFRALQLGGDPSGRAPALLEPADNRDEGPFLQSVRLHAGNDAVDIVALDSRTHRTPERVLSGSQWQDLNAYLDGLTAPQGKRTHLLVVSAVPVVHLRFRAVGWILRNLIPGVQEIEDDVLDQWEHPAHLDERARLILTLLRHQARSRCRVTILSGDVHAGALGKMESTRDDHQVAGAQPPARIMQITSSGIVHPSPSSWQRTALELLGAEGEDEVTAGVATTMMPIDSQSDRLWARNFLLIDVDHADATVPHQLWARFIPEERRAPRVVTITPLPSS